MLTAEQDLQCYRQLWQRERQTEKVHSQLLLSQQMPSCATICRAVRPAHGRPPPLPVRTPITPLPLPLPPRPTARPACSLVCLFVCLSVCLSVYLPAGQPSSQPAGRLVGDTRIRYLIRTWWPASHDLPDSVTRKLHVSIPGWLQFFEPEIVILRSARLLRRAIYVL